MKPLVTIETLPGGTPIREPREGDAGYDVFARIDPEDESPFLEGGMCLMPLTTYKIPLGFKAALPMGWSADIRPRSGLSSKGVHIALGLIDESYRGEWAAIVTPLTRSITIHNGDKIAQVTFSPAFRVHLEEGKVSNDTVRGEGGFGSTGMK